MTIKEALERGIKKITQSDWGRDYLELPQPDPDGFRDSKARMVCYFYPDNEEQTATYVTFIEDADSSWIPVLEPPTPQPDIPEIMALNEEVITFDDAKLYKLTFNQKYIGMTLDQVARSNGGLKYLDWILGQPWLKEHTKKYVKAYMSNEAIQRDLERLI